MDNMFPDMSNYDIASPNGIALYYIHSDLYPFKQLIETIRSGLDVYTSSYFDFAREAKKENDFFTESKFIDRGTIYRARGTPLAYYSILLMLVSILEEGFNTLCRAHQGVNNYNLEFTDISGQGMQLPLKEIKRLHQVKLGKRLNSTIFLCSQSNRHSKKPPNPKQRKR